MSDSNIPEIVRALEFDDQLSFKKKGGKFLQGGTCPSCSKKELYISRNDPWLLKCGRENNCDYSESTRSRYPELFDSYSDRFPPTQDDPIATARAYLTENRGFNSGTVAGWYSQGLKTIWGPDNQKIKDAITVRIAMKDGHYWERLVDRDDVKLNDNKKTDISKGCSFKNWGWQPPSQTIETGDWVFITEAIFKSIALVHADFSDLEFNVKTIAAISSSNLPRDIIEANKNKNITWVLAEDNDNAGIKASKKFRDELEAIGQKVRIALPRIGKDWDDEWRNKELTSRYIKESLWRGALVCAANYKEAAFWLYAKFPSPYMRFEFDSALYRASKDDKKSEQNELHEFMDDISGCWYAKDEPILPLKDLITKVTTSLNFERISNCAPRFLYIEKDGITDEQFYFFSFTFASGNPESLIPLEGAALESASSFNKALLNRTSGGTFDGTAKDLKFYRDRWFDHKASVVTSMPFVGYDKDSQAYLFPNHGYHKGRLMDVNKQGYMQAGDSKVKVGLRSIQVRKAEGQADFFDAFFTAFSINGMALMAWWLGTLFAEQIRAKHKSWPFMEFTGDQGAGKTTIIETLWRCVGIDDEEGFDPNKATNAGRARKLVQVSNLPVVLIEGDRNDDDRGARKGQFDLDELKTTYNGRGFRSLGVAKRGSDTETLPFRGGICISQNATVDGSEALLSRIVHCHCTRAHHNDASTEAVKYLNTIETVYLASFLDRALRNESKILNAFDKHFKQVHAHFTKTLPAVQNRLILNHAQIAAFGLCLPIIFGDQVTENHTTNLVNHLVERASDRQTRLVSDHPLVQLFWEVYEAENDKCNSVDGHRLPALFNHSLQPQSTVAVSLVDFEKICHERKLARMDFAALRRLLPLGQSYKFLGKKAVKSAILGDGKTCKCLVFAVGEQNT
jgi:hypothetical protein